MSSYATIAVERDDSSEFAGTRYLTLDRKDKLNAINGQMVEELRHAIDALAADDDARVVVLRGRGLHFCGGGDLAWMQMQMGRGREERVAEARKMAAMFAALDALPKTVIGWVTGYAFGGALGLMACCDIVMLDEESMLKLSETQLGLIPATIMPYLLARLGERGVRQLALNGAVFDPETALRLGLASAVHNKNERKYKLNYQISEALKAGPTATAATKALIADLGPKPGIDVIEETAARLADQWETPEAQAGIAAFFRKQPTPWAPPE